MRGRVTTASGSVPARMRRAIAAFAAVAAACGLAAAPAPAATRAVALGAADAGDCIAAPCGSFGYAYRQAGPGDVVQVGGGDYPAQEIPSVAGRTAPPVEIRPAPGAGVRVAELDVHGAWITLRDIGQSGGESVDVTDASNVAILGGSARGLWINNVSDLLVQDGAYGGKNDQTPVLIGGDPLSHRITFDRVDFHDAVATRSDTHQECLLANSPQGMTIRNSIFRNCAYFGALIATCCGSTAPPRDVLIENTVFERTYQWNRQPAPYSLLVSGITAANFTFRNNTFQTEPGFNETTWVNSRMVGNLGTLGSCQDNLTYAHNVWTTRTCGPTDTRSGRGLSDFVNPAAHDWHLLPSAVAIGKGDPGDRPATDRDGFLRDSDPDAGADEFGNGPATTPGTTPAGGGGQDAAGRAGAPRILSARLLRKRICKVRRRRCPRSTRLVVRVSADARLTARLRRSGRARRTLRKRALAGRRARLVVRARGLRRGRYRITLVATDAAGRRSARRTLRLRVR